MGFNAFDRALPRRPGDHDGHRVADRKRRGGIERLEEIYVHVKALGELLRDTRKSELIHSRLFGIVFRDRGHEPLGVCFGNEVGLHRERLVWKAPDDIGIEFAVCG